MASNYVVALMAAAEEDHRAVVKLLLANGADVNAADTDGDTALAIAEEWDNTTIARMLRDAGATDSE